MPADARPLAAELSRRAAQRPEVVGMVAPYRALLATQSPAEDVFSSSPLSEAEIRARLGQGVPVLAPEDFQADREALKWLWEEVCAIAARHFPDLGPALESIRRWPDGREQYLGVPSGDYCLYFCDRYRCYLNVVDRWKMAEEPPLPVQRILTCRRSINSTSPIGRGA